MSTEVDLTALYAQHKPAHLLLCTHTLSLGYIEHQLLTRFRREFDTRVTVCTSSLGMATTYNESYGLTGPGTDYWLYEIPAGGHVFHPKIFFSIEHDGSTSLIVGGANLTHPGMCLNADAVCQVSLDELTRPSQRRMYDLLLAMQKTVPNTSFHENLRPFVDAVRKAQVTQNADRAFLSNTSESILSSVVEEIGKPVIRIRIVSPYYDPDMFALSKTAEFFTYPPMEILCNADDRHVNLSALPSDCRAFASGLDDRYLHAKIMIFEHGDDASVVVGSANCTTPGLLRTTEDGNWEASILANDVPRKYTDALWEMYCPDPVDADAAWAFSPVEDFDPGTSANLHFSAHLSLSSLLTIVPHLPLPNEYRTALLIFTMPNGIEESMDADGDLASGQIDISHLEYVTQADCPTQLTVELLTHDGVHHRGRCWIHRSYTLSKSRAARMIEGRLRSLSDPENPTWDGIEDVISFLFENLGKFSVSTKSLQREARGDSRQRDALPAVTKVIYGSSSTGESDVSLGSHQVFEMADLRSRVGEWLKRGLEKLTAFDVSDEPLIGAEATTARPNHTSSTRQAADTEGAKTKLADYLDSIDDLRPYFESGLARPYRRIIARVSRHGSAWEGVLAHLGEGTELGMRLVRSVRVELPSIALGQRLERQSHQWFYSETDAIIETFIKLGLKGEKVVRTPERFKTLRTRVSALSMCSDLLLYAAERYEAGWHFAATHRGNKDIVGSFLMSLVREVGRDQASDSVMARLRDFSLYRSEGTHALTETNQVPTLFRSIGRHRRLANKYGPLFASLVKHSFWAQAEQAHKAALDYYRSHPEASKARLPWHENRLREARDKLTFLTTRVRSALGDRYDERILNSQSFCLVDELRSANGSLYCPKCDTRLNRDMILDLNEFRAVDCIGGACETVFVPAYGRLPNYDLNAVSDTSWNQRYEEDLP